MTSSQSTQICDQCGLPYGRGGVIASQESRQLHFCCYGCSFTYSVLGEHGEAGKAGLFLARLGFAAFLAMNIMALSWALYDKQWITFGMDPEALPMLEKLLFVLSVPVMVFVGWPYLQNSVREIRSRSLSVDSLIALGSFAAFGFSTHQTFTGGHGIYYDTATMTLVLVTAGRYLEAHAKVRTSDAMKKLIELQPDRARVISENIEEFVPSEEVPLDGIVKILPGERIPLDGTVIDGSTRINESILTGESLPVTKNVDDRVFAATVNMEGVIRIRVTALSADSVHAGIVRLMEEAQKTRSPIQQMVDRISGAFIPLVIGLAVITFAGWWILANPETALLHALTVLVVACPCALGIGTPLAGAVSIGKSADHGILVRSTTILERLADAKHFVFDKTGTLTRGELRVWEVKTELDPGDFLGVLASLESNSGHPIGRAVAAYANEKKVQSLKTRNISVRPGFGITGEVKIGGTWQMVEAGSAEMFAVEEDADKVKHDDERAATVIYAAWGGNVKGSVTFNDALRHGAKEVIASLHRLGQETFLLSGDSKTITGSIAETLAIRNAYGKFKPQDKLKMLHDLQLRGTTVMVGDGINDAPALAAADIGMTLGSATDIAKEAADITILGDHLEKIPWLLQFSRRTVGTIRWNLLWAFGYNAIGIALAMVGLLEPIMAAVAMVASSLFIIVNSRRLARGENGGMRS